MTDEGQSMQFDYRVVDYGSLEDMAENREEADTLILLVRARDWEKEKAFEVFEKYRDYKKIIFVSNYGYQKAAREYARFTGRRVYCFPLDENPFCVNEPKAQFFQKMLEKEGW